MARPVKFAFAPDAQTEGLELRLAYLVFKHRARGSADAELPRLLSRGMADEGVVVEPVDADAGQPDEEGPIVFLVRKNAPAGR